MNYTLYLVGIAVAASVNTGCDKRNSPGDREDESMSSVNDRPSLEEDNRPVDKTRKDNEMREKEAGIGEAEEKDRARAKADIQAAAGKNINGEALFTEKEDGVKIVVKVADAPVGEKGIHIHEKGDCSDIPGKSMGSHFSPNKQEHGLPSPLHSDIHLGDLGNIDVKDDGKGKKEITVKKANLRDGDPMSLIGKALVIHQDKDKGASHQPSGGSGDPIACGVIKQAS